MKTALLFLMMFFSLNPLLKAQAGKVDSKTINALIGKIRQGLTDEVINSIEADTALVTSKNAGGNSLIHIACENKNQKLTDYLLSKGANIEAKNNFGSTPLQMAVYRANDVAFSEYLINKGADVNAIDIEGSSVLHLAAIKGNVDMINLLVNKGAKLNLQTIDANKMSPLHYALWSNNVEIINALVKAGIDIEIQTSEGYSALHNAVVSNKINMIEVLVNNGANIELKTNKNETPLYLAVNRGDPAFVKYFLSKGAKTGNITSDKGQTELHAAVIGGYVEIAELLIKKEVDVNIKDKNGNTPLYYAKKYGFNNMAKSLLANGAKEIKGDFKDDTKEILAGETKGYEPTIWHLEHTGWAMKTKNHFLIFDYCPAQFMPQEPKLMNGNIVAEEIANQNVIVFVSHAHGDHFSDSIFAWKNKVKNITYVYGFDAKMLPQYKDKAYNGPEYTTLLPHETKQVGNMTINTLKANDTGVGFLIEVDGLTVYHSGDHASRNQGLMSEYKSEIDYLSTKLTKDIDYAFVSVIGCGAWEQEPVQEGFCYAVNKLKIKNVFPQHGGKSFDRYLNYIQIAAKNNLNTKVITATYKGEKFKMK